MIETDIRKKCDVEPKYYEKCHNGIGKLECYSMLHEGDSELGLDAFHYDTIPPNVSIGEHTHYDNEEIYFLAKGSCTLIYDGVEHDMVSGDISLVNRGHSHGLINTGNDEAVLIVVSIVK